MDVDRFHAEFDRHPDDRTRPFAAISGQVDDEPVMIPQNQGVVPGAVVVDTGGECVWASDE